MFEGAPLVFYLQTVQSPSFHLVSSDPLKDMTHISSLWDLKPSNNSLFTKPLDPPFCLVLQPLLSGPNQYLSEATSLSRFLPDASLVFFSYYEKDCEIITTCQSPYNIHISSQIIYKVPVPFFFLSFSLFLLSWRLCDPVTVNENCKINKTLAYGSLRKTISWK